MTYKETAPGAIRDAKRLLTRHGRKVDNQVTESRKIKKKKVIDTTIEERAIQAWGTTDDPVCAIYMTRDGTLVDGSYDGLQRDKDHREISQFFKKSKLEDPGSATIYVKKFMRRGNMRVGCHETGFVIETLTTPTEKQLAKILGIHATAYAKGIEFAIGRVDRKNFNKITFLYLEEYIRHLLRYHMIDEYAIADVLYAFRDETR